MPVYEETPTGQLCRKKSNQEIRLPKKKVLFISHDATRTGAPTVFLHFLKWVKANTDISFRILLGNGGDLESEFKAVAPVMLFNREISSLSGLARRASRLRGARGVVRRAYRSSL